MNLEKIQDACFKKAHILIDNGYSHDMDIFELTDLLVAMEIEKEEKQQIEDSKIDFNDEIMEIEEVGELETVDISVTGNQLFYCNDILTKNSMGIAHTADCILGLISSEELESLNQIMIKQLKNRWGDLSFYRRFVVGINRAKMRIFDLEENAQGDINNETTSQFKERVRADSPAFDSTDFGKETFSRLKDHNKEKKSKGFK